MKKERGKPKVAKVMREFSKGKLRSGSKRGPKVMSKKSGKRRMPEPASDDSFGVR